MSGTAKTGAQTGAQTGKKTGAQTGKKTGEQGADVNDAGLSDAGLNDAGLNDAGARVDLSVIVTAHDETLVSGPTMQAADRAIAAARAAGFAVEALIVLDRATPDCAAWFGQPALDHWRRVRLEEGDLGRARNAAVGISRGAFIAFVDADDLVSENWFSEGCRLLAAARAAGERRIVHPELNWLFDGGRSVYFKPDQDDVLFTPWYFYAMNYYDSMCLCPREVHEQIPYASRDIPNGLSYQDWQFSVETMAAGWRHVSARDTVIFKRRRDNSLVTESRNRQSVVRALPAMAIDAIGDLGAPHNRRPQPEPALPAPAPAPAPGLAPGLGAVLEGGLDRGLAGRLRRFSARAARRLARSWPQVRPALARVAARVAARVVPGVVPGASGAADQGAAEGAEMTREGAVPHHGPGLAARVAYARRHSDRDPARGVAGYGRVARAMDLDYYLACAPDLVAARRVDPVGHYIRMGVAEGRNPTPHFGTLAYLERYPEAARDPAGPFHHYLTRGAAQGHVAAPYRRFEEMAAILGMTPRAAEALLQARYEGLRARLEHGRLGEMVNRAAALEPLISATWPEALSVRVPPFHSDIVVSRVAAIHALCQAAGLRRARAVICVNRARWGGARRMEGHIAHALAAGIGAGEIVVLSTDRGGEMPPGRLPEGVRHIPFAELVVPLPDEEAQRVLVQFLRALRPEVVFNVNSRLMWDALGPYGRAMRASFRIIGCLFCNERTDLGHATGYPLTRVYRHFELLSGLVTDSHALACELRARHMLSGAAAARITVLSAPVDPTIAPVSAPAPAPGRRPQIFWSGRFDAQKRVDLVYEVARLRPDWDLRLWGEAVMSGLRALPARPANLHLEGTYARFCDLPLDAADAWLYTSGWDGVPSILLEVAMAGVPLVGSDAGGTTEVLQEGLAEALPPEAGAEAYVAALERVLADPAAARARAARLRARLIETRDPEAYAQAVMALFAGPPPPDAAPAGAGPDAAPAGAGPDAAPAGAGPDAAPARAVP